MIMRRQSFFSTTSNPHGSDNDTNTGNDDDQHTKLWSLLKAALDNNNNDQREDTNASKLMFPPINALSTLPPKQLGQLARKLQFLIAAPSSSFGRQQRLQPIKLQSYLIQVITQCCHHSNLVMHAWDLTANIIAAKRKHRDDDLFHLPFPLYQQLAQAVASVSNNVDTTVGSTAASNKSSGIILQQKWNKTEFLWQIFQWAFTNSIPEKQQQQQQAVSETDLSLLLPNSKDACHFFMEPMKLVLLRQQKEGDEQSLASAVATILELYRRLWRLYYNHDNDGDDDEYFESNNNHFNENGVDKKNAISLIWNVPLNQDKQERQNAFQSLSWQLLQIVYSLYKQEQEQVGGDDSNHDDNLTIMIECIHTLSRAWLQDEEERVLFPWKQYKSVVKDEQDKHNDKNVSALMLYIQAKQEAQHAVEEYIKLLDEFERELEENGNENYNDDDDKNDDDDDDDDDDDESLVSFATQVYDHWNKHNKGITGSGASGSLLPQQPRSSTVFENNVTTTQPHFNDDKNIDDEEEKRQDTTTPMIDDYGNDTIYQRNSRDWYLPDVTLQFEEAQGGMPLIYHRNYEDKIIQEFEKYDKEEDERERDWYNNT